MKKYLFIIFVLLLAGCQKVEPSLAPQDEIKETKKVETTEFKTLSSFPIKETFLEAQKSSRQFSVETLPLEEGFQIYDYDGDTTGKYSPKDNVLYLLTTDKPETESITHIEIYHLSTGEKKKVPFDKPYRYFQEGVITENGYEFIGTELGEVSANHVIVSKEGKIEQRELYPFGEVAASPIKKGFVLKIDEQREGKYFAEMTFLPYGKEEVEKLFQEPFQHVENASFGVTGTYFRHGDGVENWIGFQLLNYSDKTVPEVKGSYLFDVDKKELYSFGFMKKHCENFMGNKEFILALEKEHFESSTPDPQRCKLYLYNEKTGRYEYTVLPEYDYCGFIRSVDDIGNNILVVGSAWYLDIVNLNNNKIYRYRTHEKNIYPFYYDRYIYYFRQKDNGNYTMYYKELPRELLQGESTKG